MDRPVCDNWTMLRLELTLPTPAENVALDEALLEWAEAADEGWEFLRLWESAEPLVVVGRSSRLDQEVNEAACRERGVAILRRSSGGAAIVAGPGCLMYAVVLSLRLRPQLKDIRRAHRFVLDRLASAIQSLLPTAECVHCQGTSDLVLDRQAMPASCSPIALTADSRPALKKFSGNSMRAKRTHLLYHGTLLYDFDLELVEEYLRMPRRQPDYRGGRPHSEFVANLPLHRDALVDAIDRAWPTTGSLRDWPKDRVAELVTRQFGRDAWNREFG